VARFGVVLVIVVAVVMSGTQPVIAVDAAAATAAISNTDSDGINMPRNGSLQGEFILGKITIVIVV
jgi:hypothetical protein